jgi:hypothetical protein
MKTPLFPTPEKIQEVITLFEKRVASRSTDPDLKEGYILSIEILKDRLKNPGNSFFIPTEEGEIPMAVKIYEDQLKPVNNLKTLKGRAVAILCIDWLNGDEKSLAALKENQK